MLGSKLLEDVNKKLDKLERTYLSLGRQEAVLYEIKEKEIRRIIVRNELLKKIKWLWWRFTKPVRFYAKSDFNDLAELFVAKNDYFEKFELSPGVKIIFDEGDLYLELDLDKVDAERFIDTMIGRENLKIDFDALQNIKEELQSTIDQINKVLKLKEEKEPDIQKFIENMGLSM